MNANSDTVAPTLGESLAVDAGRVARRWRPRIGWLDLLAPLIRRSVALPVAGARRYARRETLPPRANVPAPGRINEVGTARETGDPLAADERQRLRPLLGAAADAMRIHRDSDADAHARVHGADAVTIGRDVFFRRGAFEPREPRGIALIGHEAFHVASFLQPNASWRRATTAGVHEEEELAAARERRLLGLAARNALAIAPRAPAIASRTDAARAAASPAARPMRAELDRPLGAPSPGTAPVERSAEEIRKSAVRDLMNQIRVEFERGA